MEEVNIFIAFGAGFLSFVSPCVLPLFPAFLSFITAMSGSELSEDNTMLSKKRMILTTLFLLRRSAVFIMIGFSTNIIAEFFKLYHHLIRQVGSIVIVLFGLVIVGILSFDFLMKTRQLSFKNRPTGFIGSFLIGIACSMGWTPSTGPILMIVISLA